MEGKDGEIGASSSAAARLLDDITCTAEAPMVESEFRATGIVQQSTGIEGAKSLPHVVVKWFPKQPKI